VRFGPVSILGMIVTLVLGIGIGVAVDRLYLNTASRSSLKTQLVGSWDRVGSHDPLVINDDGTFTREIPGLGMPNQVRTGQWQWLDDDHVQLDSFGEQGFKARVVIKDNELKLIPDSGEVRVYRRK
jgi:hypothetical protein